MSRLTKKEPNNLSCHHFRKCEYLRNGTPRVETLNKLGKLEDILEKYNIDSVEELDVLLGRATKNKELEDKVTPKKLKQTTDKDGRLLWVCPTCGDVYKKFWSEVETVTHRRHCEACGQKLDWSRCNE